MTPEVLIEIQNAMNKIEGSADVLLITPVEAIPGLVDALKYAAAEDGAASRDDTDAGREYAEKLLADLRSINVTKERAREIMAYRAGQRAVAGQQYGEAANDADEPPTEE
jgi:hypothetical protein